MCISLVFMAAFFADKTAPAPIAPRSAHQLVDRIAVTIGKDAITEGEALDEIRITAFLNGEQPDFSPESRRAAAERLVDQELIRREATNSHYAEPNPGEAESMLREFKKAHFTSDADYRRKLRQYGITEKQLQEHLLWELTAIRFTDLRFQPGGPSRSTETLRHRLDEHARLRARDEASRDAAPASAGGWKAKPAAPDSASDSVEARMDAWLKDARRSTRIEFRKEAFE